MVVQYCVLGDHHWTPPPGKGRAARACPDHYDRNALRRWRRQEDPEGWRARDRVSYQQKCLTNPTRMQMQIRRHASSRRALQRGQFIEPVDPLRVYEMHGGRCGICGEFIDGAFHVDHVKPLARGGLHGYINVQPAHPRCNLVKNARV